VTGYQYAPAYWEAGWIPVPLPHGKKTPPPQGATGRGARDVWIADIQTWLDDDPNANIALRMPKNVVGLDFDLYKESGRETLAAMTAQYGELPATWRSSSRTDGSGIMFFRTDPSRTDALRDPIGGGKGGLEIIRWSHRYAVVMPSLHPEGGTYLWYGPDGQRSTAPKVGELPELPQAWLDALTPEEKAEHSAATVAVTAEGLAKAGAYERKAVGGLVARLQAMTAAAASPSEYRGEPWDQTTYYVACRLFEIANATWSSLTPQEAEGLVMQYAPRDPGFPDARVHEKISSAARTVGSNAAAPPTGGTSGLIDRMIEQRMAPPPSSVATESGSRKIVTDVEFDVSNHALAAHRLLGEVGSGRLAGMFSRKSDLVFTPRIGQEGYIPARSMVAEGSAAITLVGAEQLRARVQNRYKVLQLVKDAEASKGEEADVFKPRPAIFPLEAAKIVVSAVDDAPNLRELHGVVHAPTFRRDGSLITQPGYDDATGLLFLPTGGQPDAIPESPTTKDVEVAVGRLAYMLQDFAFVSDHDRATYLGLMLTPLLRNLTPPPYKLGVIEAHQPGSGKSFLARALISIHGGAMHSEMPASEEELGKVLTAVLDTQTAPVVCFDNVNGLIRSSKLAGLLTSPTYTDRRLGAGKMVEAENDRLWLITANNAALGGDLGRRNVRVRIDPGMPNPELRTGFAISDFESWVLEHRGDLLWSLLVITRAWVLRGMPMLEAPTEDSYGKWIGVVRGILSCAGVPGRFDDETTRALTIDPEAEEWTTFAQAVYDVMGDRHWTVKQLLELVAPPGWDGAEGKPLPFDAIPSAVTSKSHSPSPTLLVRSLGTALGFKKGRWFSEFSFIDTGVRIQRVAQWKVARRS